MGISQMITKNFIFYKPNFDFKEIYHKKDQIIFIKKDENKIDSPDNYIPCMFYRNPDSPYFLICFHGNSEDIFTAEPFGLNFRSYLNMNVLFVEYPSYSLYFDNNPNQDKIYSDSIIVYNWVKKKFNISDKQIFIYGRSLGTSPAIYLSSKVEQNGLIIVSPFKSIKSLECDKWYIKFLEDIFNSIDYINNVKCPILFIHGEKDDFIYIHHSEELLKKVKKFSNCKIYDIQKNKNMSHNDFDVKTDIIEPISLFLKNNKLILNNKYPVININNQGLTDLYEIPKCIQREIESKIFKINEFSIESELKLKNYASFFMGLSDKRMALVNGLYITIYDNKYFKEDYTIDLNKYNIGGKINSICQIKNENIICSTSSGYIFVIEIYDEDYNIKITKQLNEIIYKVEDLNSNEILILSDSNITVYDTDLNQKLFEQNNKNKFTNFLKTDDSLVFLDDKKLSFYKYEEKNFKFNNYYNLKNKNINNYSLAKMGNYLIMGYNNIIAYINENKQEIEENILEFNEENIISIYRIHDELYLASTDKGSILQIIINNNMINENKEITLEINRKKFLNKPIKSVFLKNFRNILFISENNIYISNIKKNENNCIIF